MQIICLCTNLVSLQCTYNIFVLVTVQVLLELARNRNKIPLPKSITRPGIPLPPEQDTLINPNYQFAITKKQSKQAIEEAEDDEEAADPNPNPSQEQRIDASQGTPQGVSFPIGPKRSG